jgi:ABC-type branched-subunit amino acid transport system ATPase component
MLEIKGLYKSFDGIQAVRDFSLSLQDGKITSLIGPNGAGKTTVFNLVTGYLPYTQGSILYEGRSFSGLTPWKIAQRGITRTFQNLRLFRKLTVLENVLLGRQGQSGENTLNALFLFSNKSVEHQKHREVSKSFLEFVGLADKQDELAENLSYGQQKLLSIACCLAAEPKVLLLDEPVSGVQPEMINKITYILKELVTKQQKTIWLIEHDIDFVLKISDTVIVMDDGAIITQDDPQAIKSNPAILEAYLS